MRRRVVEGSQLLACTARSADRCCWLLRRGGDPERKRPRFQSTPGIWAVVWYYEGCSLWSASGRSKAGMVAVARTLAVSVGGSAGQTDRQARAGRQWEPAAVGDLKGGRRGSRAGGGASSALRVPDGVAQRASRSLLGHPRIPGQPEGAGAHGGLARPALLSLPCPSTPTCPSPTHPPSPAHARRTRSTVTCRCPPARRHESYHPYHASLSRVLVGARVCACVSASLCRGLTTAATLAPPSITPSPGQRHEMYAPRAWRHRGQTPPAGRR